MSEQIRPKTYDLTRFEEQLPNRPEYRALKKLIPQAIGAYSLKRDLGEARSLLELLVDSRLRPAFGLGNRQQHQIGGALFGQAIVAYCRGMDRNGIRGVISYQTFPDHLVAKDKEIKQIRDNVYAHALHRYVKGKWRSEKLTVELGLEINRYRYPFTYFNYTARVVETLGELIDHVLPLADRAYRETHDQMHNELDIQLFNSADLRDLLGKFEFNPSKFFPDQAGVEGYYAADGDNDSGGDGQPYSFYQPRDTSDMPG